MEEAKLFLVQSLITRKEVWQIHELAKGRGLKKKLIDIANRDLGILLLREGSKSYWFLPKEKL